MKKLFFIMAMSVCAFTAQAQTTSGIRVGLNMTSATGKYNDLMACLLYTSDAADEL